MKNNYFQKVEDKYVFNLSRIFWHIFIAIGTLAIIGGIAVLIYSVVPNFKTKVEKAQYPPEVKVELSDIHIEKPQPPPSTFKPATEQAVPVVQTPVPVSSDPDRPAYDQLLKQLELLIPQDKYSWSGSGHFEYPYGIDSWNYYQQDKYRIWVQTGGGLLDHLNEAYDKTNSYSYKNKISLLQAYIGIIKNLNEETRLNQLYNLISNTSNDLKKSVALFDQLAISVTKFPKDNLNYLNALITFYYHNKNDGARFIDLVNAIVGNFESAQRNSALDNLIAAYEVKFNNNIEKLTILTNAFIPLLTHFKGDDQPKALSLYYRVYLSKNAEREMTISEIETQFNLATAQAEIAYQTKVMAKKELRMTSLMGIGAGVAAISMLAILLVFLSIQRSVREIEDKVTAKQA